MAAFDPFARQIFCGNDDVSVESVDAKSRATARYDGAHPIAVSGPTTVCEMMTRDVGKPDPDSWFHPGSG